jgi:EAL and modified HD-GYP domain-containing signal transduction protein
VDVYVARQPILDRFQRTHAYELLFRDGTANVFGGGDPDLATAKVIDTSFFVLGVETLTGGRRGFVNFTRDALVGGYATALPSSVLVVEILEDVPADAEVVETCLALKGAGYAIALDDIVTSTPPEALLALADIVKVDFRQTSMQARRQIAQQIGRRGIKVLAEKVETEEEFAQAVADGYDYFQGHFFARPTIVAGREIPASKLNMLRLLREVHRPDPDHARVEDVIKHEVALALKLLTHLRSAAWGLRQPVESVQHAILFLGDRGLRKWASVVAMATLGNDRPNELVVTSVIRASFCEGLLVELGLDDLAQHGFLLGLFSMIDAFLGRPLAEAVERLPLSDEVRTALLGRDNVLRRIYNVVLAWELGAWDEVSTAAAALGLGGDAIAARYRSAVEFGNSVASTEVGDLARV